MDRLGPNVVSLCSVRDLVALASRCIAHSLGVHNMELMARSRIPRRMAPLVASAAFVLATLVSACSTTSPQATSSNSIPSRLSLAQANDVTLMAIGLVGTPYRYGGNTPSSGFDCSGLIGYVYKARAGLLPPRSVAGLVNWGAQVLPEDVRTGDLAIFLQGDIATHAGIYVGEGRFVHAPSTGGVVRLDRLTSKYWATQPAVFRRP
jgi:cell wall-associated NlpC family hydrolase